MKTSIVLTLLFVPVQAIAGQLGTLLPWISHATPTAELTLNNDDYMGVLEDNPNRFRVNGRFGGSVIQPLANTERIVATLPSGGITEYAISVGASYSETSDVSLDNLFQVQLGFGVGAAFIQAREVAPELKFDGPDSPGSVIDDYFHPMQPDSPIPMLKLIDRQGDTLTYQGSSRVGPDRISSIADSRMIKLPLDIPDLPSQVRGLYTPADLESLGPDELPFTIRIRFVAPDGDFDADGDVDGADLLAWQRGASPTPLSASDFATWQAAFGAANEPVAPVGVPEPATLVAALAAVLAGAQRRQGRTRSASAHIEETHS